MTQHDAFGRTVSDWLHDQADWMAPGYLDEVLAETGRTRQRPWWSSFRPGLPSGWVVPALPGLRGAWLLVVLALLVALVAGALSIGSRPKLPPPFGLTGNGFVVYGAGDGDLYALDLESGLSSPIVTGGPQDETPDFSHDGTRFVFAREAETAGRWILMVADADGRNVRPLTGPVDPRWNGWSPDDTRVAVADAATAKPTLTIYFLDGRAPVPLDTGGRLAASAAFRPDGLEIVFLGSQPRSYGIYAVATAGESSPRTLVPPSVGGLDITNPIMSPDGSVIAYTRWEIDHSVIHLVDIDTGDDQAKRLDPASDGENAAAWSPDGSRLLFHSHRDGSYQLAIAPVSGGEVARIGPILPEGDGGAEIIFAPDGRTVIARYLADGSSWLFDVAGGPGRPLDIDAAASVTWQRVVP